MIISSTEFSPWGEGKERSGKGMALRFSGTGQTIRGFGGCFNELGMAALEKLPQEERKAFLDELFHADRCNFNYCRVPIGANDFSFGYYSYDDADGDFDMKQFSVRRDEKYIIPFITEAMRRQPDLQLSACPWTPPIWMKTSKAYNFGVFDKTAEKFRAYALYFKKYVKEYKGRGIPLVHIFPQNEPCSTQSFPSCEWSGEELAEFIGKYLGPALEGTGVEIIFGTINGPEQREDKKLSTGYTDYLGAAMRNAACRRYIKGVGYQWAGKNALLATQDDYPELEIIQTESECGDGKNSWRMMLYVFTLMRHYFRMGASAYQYWNLALEDGGRSTWGWAQNSLLTVKNGHAIYNPEFYLMKHFSHFVKRGAKYVFVTGEFSSNVAAFENPDGKRVVIVANPYREEVNISLEDKGYVLPPNSINTICL